MSLIEPFTPEGIDPTVDYAYICIDRVNQKVNAIGDITALTASVATLTTKMNNSYKVINIKDYGAIGDGVVNDTTSINNAIAAVPANRGILYFPSGKYLISNTIFISNKTNLLVISDNAEIVVSQLATTAMYFSDCPLLQAVVGSLTFTTTSSGASPTKIAFMYGCLIAGANFSIKNIKVIGAFQYGIYLISQYVGYNTSSISNCMVDGLSVGTTGIYLPTATQYVEILDTKVSDLLGTGFLIEGGNNTITGCMALNCRIGCFIDSISGGNLDHSLVNGSTFNHNRACGIFVRSLQLNMAINNCKIWANNGPDVLTEAINSVGKTLRYGVYLENVKGLVMTGNTFAHNNQIDLGIDGMNTSIINNNVFRSVSTTAYTIYEMQSAGTINHNNQICNNTFNGACANVANLRWCGGRFYLGNMANDGCYNYLIKDNSGEAGENDMLMDVNSGDYYIGFANNYVIDAVTITTMNSIDPNGQIANIWILPHATGTAFKLNFRRNNVLQYTWVRYKTNNVSSVAPYITSANIVYFLAEKAFRIGANSVVYFTPMNKSTLGNWAVSAF
jgi:hypothetical protein